MSNADLESILNETDLGDASALEIALAEIRRQYDDEETRRQSLESKTGGLLALDAVLIPLVINLIVSAKDFIIILLIGILLSSSGLCIITLRSEQYRRPLREPMNILPYAQIEEHEAKMEFLKIYIATIHHNRQINDTRYRRFNIALYVTAIAIVATGIVAIQLI